MSTRSRPARIVVLASMLIVGGCQGLARGGTGALASSAPTDLSPIRRAKVDPLQPPPRDPVPNAGAAHTAGRSPAPVPPLGPTDPALLSGTWSGTYLYARRGESSSSSVAFFADLAFDGKRLTGSMIEPNTFGDDTSGELKARLEGSIDDGGVVRFTKSYDGTAGVGHRVDYVGRLDVAAQRIEGTWSLDGESGRFVMMRHAAMPQLAMRSSRRSRSG
jgi:hypothetical protein